MSGYRSPTYNDALRKCGVRAADGSLHTEGLAADVAFPAPLCNLWMYLRGLDRCGAGYCAVCRFIRGQVRGGGVESESAVVASDLGADGTREAGMRATSCPECQTLGRSAQRTPTATTLREEPISLSVSAMSGGAARARIDEGRGSRRLISW